MKIQVDKEIQNIFSTFLMHKFEEIQLLQNSLKKNDFQTIKTIGHNLAGSSKSYGVEELGIIGSKIEKSAEEKDIEQIEEYILWIQYFLKNIEVEFV
jgi:HPt (histidine-containing phosphotransfer) domain-containing protein